MYLLIFGIGIYRHILNVHNDRFHSDIFVHILLLPVLIIFTLCGLLVLTRLLLLIPSSSQLVALIFLSSPGPGDSMSLIGQIIRGGGSLHNLYNSPRYFNCLLVSLTELTLFIKPHCRSVCVGKT